MTRVSAGLLMYRRAISEWQFFLAHPGGPFSRKKDLGFWTIPKGEQGAGESLLEVAQREFEEETGIKPQPPFLELGSIKQAGGKIVHAWAFEGNHEGPIRSNTFSMEWPPASGKMAVFPEVDRAEFFGAEEARSKIKDSQWPLIQRLIDQLKSRG